jgi:uncharacterized SAM-binding protein YcdF (DUF218 family)
MDDIDRAAKILWDYHKLNQPLRKADAIFVLGSHDIRVAEYAAELYLQGYAPLLILSGNGGKTTKEYFTKTEAETFADIALERGVPAEHILLEKEATNTGENVIFTKKLLDEHNLHPQSFVLIQKPYMERRTYATFKKVWPDVEFTVTSPPIPFDEYPNAGITKQRMYDNLVGDLYRIKVYPEKGFQIPQEIPPEVWQAYETLVASGYNKP